MSHPFKKILVNTVFILLISLLPSLLYAQDPGDNPFVLTDDTGTLSLKENCEYYLDGEGRDSLEDVLSREFIRGEGDLNFGLTDDTAWIRFSAENLSSRENWILEFNIHKFYSVEIYTGHAGEEPSLSHSYSFTQPFREREIQEPYLAFPVHIPRGTEVAFYVKVQSENSLEIPLLLHSSESYFLKITQMKSLFSTIYGILMAMFFYNIFIYLFIRDRNYLYYVAYVLVYTIYLSALNGYGAKFLWPFIQGRWTTIFSAVFGGVSLFIGCYLTREFLQTKTRLPAGDRALKVLAFLGLLLSVIIFVFKRFMISFIYGNMIGTVVLLGIVIVTVISFSRGYKPALYFLISYSTIIVAQIAYSLLSIGPFGEHFFLKNLNQYAPVFQMVLLSLSLSYRFNLIRIEKDMAQEAALTAETALASGLEEKVQERTRELKEANDKLESLSYVDSLTGLYNRRYFDKVLRGEWKRHSRENRPLSLIMCDIDHFKEFNDSIGHLAGDECLRKIARTFMQSARRESDIPARYGGEEFILILPQTGFSDVSHIARKIKDSVDSLKLPHPAFPGRFVTISLGVSTTIPSPGVDSHRLIEFADKALYQSKEAGRDRITYCDPEVVSSLTAPGEQIGL